MTRKTPPKLPQNKKSPDSSKELSANERDFRLKTGIELKKLRGRQLDTKTELDDIYSEWEKLDALAPEFQTATHAAELQRLVKRRDAAAEAFDAATETFETRVAELLADPETAGFVQEDLEEMRKAEAYQSSQSRGEGTTYGSAPHDYLRYRLKESAVVVQSGRDNPVFYPETVLKGSVDTEAFVEHMVRHGGINAPAAASVMNAVRTTLLELTRMGFSVNLFDLFIVKPSLRGTCTRTETDSAFHRSFMPFLTTRATPGLLRDFRANLGARQLKDPAGGIVIAGIRGSSEGGSSEDSKTFAPGEVVRITGARLDYDQAAEDEGFFLRSTNGKIKYKLAIPGLGRDVMPSQATLFFPKEALPGETLELVLCKRLRNSSVLRTYLYCGGQITVR